MRINIIVLLIIIAIITGVIFCLRTRRVKNNAVSVHGNVYNNDDDINS